MHFLEQAEAIYFILTTKYEMANKKSLPCSTNSFL